MLISKVVKEDIDEIINEEKKLLSSSLGYDFILQDLDNENALYYKITEEELIGYIGIRLLGDKAEVLNFFIKEQFQKKGYGTKLLKHVLEILIKRKIKSLILEVEKDNNKAIKLYEKLGFKKILVKKNYYVNKDAIIYLWENE
ncbi:ribosomal protein S18-alanine N-acetyltransferase [Acholeplasma sp. OttesenSCG-928-E16]|nr:ribosomal protein S18-alanine N-acetyltransferase [Acholeplasma sp. OttesenSCG-928-E16]